MSKISTYDVVPLPKLSDRLIGTSVGGLIKDKTYNFTLQELLDLFNLNSPSNSLQGVLDYNNTATQDIILYGTIYSTNIEVDTANLTSTYLIGDTHFNGTLYDVTNSVGLAGQVLSSTATGVEWITIGPPDVPNLQEVLTSGNNASIDIFLNSNIDALDINVNTETVNNNITVSGTITDGYSSVGTLNKFLSSTGTQVKWISLPTYSATSPLFLDNITKVFSIQQSNNTQSGYLSVGDWITFDGKQSAGNYITALTGEATATGPGSVPITLNNSSVTSKVLTGLSVSGSAITSTDSILTAFGKAQNQINGLIGGVVFKGTWNASANVPTLTSSVGTQGWYYIVDVAGNTNLNGITDWQIGDWAIFNGSTWNKVDNTDAGITLLNGLVTSAQYFSVGTSGTNFNISSVTNTHTFNLPTASASNRGALSSADWTTFNNKLSSISLTTTGTSGPSTYLLGVLNIPQYQAALTNPVTGTGVSGQIAYWNGTNTQTGDATLTFTPTSAFSLSNTVTASSAIARGKYQTSTLIAAANSDFLVGLDINPTFTNGAFTTVSNIGIRSQVASAANKYNFYASGTAANYFAGNTLIGSSTDNGTDKLQITGSAVIGTAVTLDISAQLQVLSTTKGFLLPRMTSSQKNTISTPANGLMVYDSTSSRLNYYDTAWKDIANTTDVAVTSVGVNIINYYNFI